MSLTLTFKTIILLFVLYSIGSKGFLYFKPPLSYDANFNSKNVKTVNLRF
jgi:predicted small lipoprotein YifL